MSEHYAASDHKVWAEVGLADGGGDYAEFVNQRETGDGDLEGDWWDTDTLPDGRRVLYYGTFGNLNQPGASHYTYADVFAPAGVDPADDAAYAADLAKWEGYPEYDPDGPCYVCQECGAELPEGVDEEDAYCEKCAVDRDGPQDEDWTTEDFRRFTRVGSAHTVDVGEDDWRVVMRAVMEADGVFPNVWRVSDHGNCELVSWED